MKRTGITVYYVWSLSNFLVYAYYLVPFLTSSWEGSLFSDYMDYNNSVSYSFLIYYVQTAQGLGWVWVWKQYQ